MKNNKEILASKPSEYSQICSNCHATNYTKGWAANVFRCLYVIISSSMVTSFSFHRRLDDVLSIRARSKPRSLKDHRFNNERVGVIIIKSKRGNFTSHLSYQAHGKQLNQFHTNGVESVKTGWSRLSSPVFTLRKIDIAELNLAAQWSKNGEIFFKASSEFLHPRKTSLLKASVSFPKPAHGLNFVWRHWLNKRFSFYLKPVK